MWIFCIVFYSILAVVFHLTGHDPVALISLEASGLFFLMYIIAKSEDK